MQIDSATELIPAAPKLLAIIRGRDKKGTVTDFAEKHGLDRYKLQKVLHGDLLSVDVDFAFACQKATRGAVKAEDFCIDEESRERLRRQRPRARSRPMRKATVRDRVESG